MSCPGPIPDIREPIGCEFVMEWSMTTAQIPPIRRELVEPF